MKAIIFTMQLEHDRVGFYLTVNGVPPIELSTAAVVLMRVPLTQPKWELLKEEGDRAMREARDDGLEAV